MMDIPAIYSSLSMPGGLALTGQAVCGILTDDDRQASNHEPEPPPLAPL